MAILFGRVFVRSKCFNFVECQIKSSNCNHFVANNLSPGIKRPHRNHYRSFKTSERVSGKENARPSKFLELLQNFAPHLKYPALIGGCTLIVAYYSHVSIQKPYINTHPHTSNNAFVDSVSARTPNISKYNFIADVVEKTNPAVVFLEIKGKHPDSGQRVTVSNGSGFLVRSDGLILTSAHVVANESRLLVKLHNGDVLEGQVTAVDPVYDLATVKVCAEGKLPFIPLGSSSDIRPGEFVVAMGSPLSLSNTVTSGIVSSSLRKSSELGLDSKNMQYIQTDAVISFGNSGGPLVNLDGKAIGINNLKVTSGISFAIPTDYALSFLEVAERNMEKDSKSDKPLYIQCGKRSTNNRRYMGIAMLTLTPSILNELKDKQASFRNLDSGVYVHQVIVGSPAYEGGLHAGDVIVEINNMKMKTTADICQVVENEPRLRVKAARGSYLHEIDVVTEELFKD